LTDTIISTRNISKKFGNFFAVDNINIQVKKGEIYGLVGKNGAGKTTLLKMINGLSIPSSGSLKLFSESSGSGIENMRSKIGTIIETPSFFPYLSAEKNLEYYRIQRGIEDKNCVNNSLEFVGLSNVGNKKFNNFSLGMKQRLGLALAIMGNPELLILDEPINGLDPMGMAEFREIILKLNHEKNTTILISSHILGELSQIATCYGFINKGKLIERVSTSELKEKCKRTLNIKVNDTNKASDVLKNKLSCTNFEISDDNEIRTDEFMNTPEVLVRTLVLNDIDVYNVNQSGLNLEQYFIELVGGIHNV
jgi:ABC-2 type transport system ATP-binding protein